MKTKKNTYYFQRGSFSDKPGFDVSPDSKSGPFYFQVNDAKGKPLLFSPEYATRQAKNTALQSFRKYLNLTSSYQIKSDPKKGKYFIFKSGNHKELGQSRYFRTVESMQSQLDYLLSGTFDFSSEVKKKTIERKRPVGHKIPELKHAFRIDLYNIEDDNRIAGKIEHSLSGKKISFKGLDFTRIEAFIREQTGIEKAKSVHEPKSVHKPIEKEEAKKSASEFIDPKLVLGPDVFPVEEVYVSQEGLSEKCKLIQEKSEFDVNIKLKQKGPLTDKKPCEIKLSAFDLASGKQINLGSQMVKPIKYLIKVPVNGYLLPHGLYLIKSSLEQKRSDSNKNVRMAGDCILKVF